MKKQNMLIRCERCGFVRCPGCVAANSAQDKYTVTVPNGLAFSEFKGYEAGRRFQSVTMVRCSR